MKLHAIAAAAAILMVGTVAQAQTKPMTPVSPYYGEVGYSFMKIDSAGTSFRPDVLRGILGYNFSPYGALEGMLGGGVSDDTKNITVSGVPRSATVEVKELYGLFAKAKYMYGATEGYARFGWAHTKVENSIGTSVSDDDFGWGFGVNWSIAPNMYVGGDWMRYNNSSGSKVDGLTFTFGWRF